MIRVRVHSFPETGSHRSFTAVVHCGSFPEDESRGRQVFGTAWIAGEELCVLTKTEYDEQSAEIERLRAVLRMQEKPPPLPPCSTCSGSGGNGGTFCRRCYGSGVSP